MMGMQNSAHKLNFVLQVTLESRFKEDLNLDSLDHVEVIMAVEDEFGKLPHSAKLVEESIPNNVITKIVAIYLGYKSATCMQ